MDEASRRALVQQLGQEMSDISEDCFCAGWLGGTEYFVPELCRRAVESGQTQYWGHGEVTPTMGRRLMDLAEQIGSWADTDFASIGYDPFQPFPIPPEYAAALERGHKAVLTHRSQSADLKTNTDESGGPVVQAGADEREFTDEELHEALHRIGREVRQEAFAAGRPVVFLKDGAIVAVHPDGREEVLERLHQESNPDARK